MKTPIFVFCVVFATALVAESQTPKTIPVTAAKPVAATEVDEVELSDDDGGKVELSTTGQGADQQVNIVCEDASISDILRQFRKVVKANIVSSDSTNLHRRVSISLYDAPWIDSLKAVLGMGGFALDERNGIYFVAEEQVESPVIRTKSFNLNHAGAEETAKLLNESFGEKDPKTGKLAHNVASVFKDANVIVVKGNDKTIRDCEDVIKTVDKAPQQVYIEARFIDLSNEAMHKLGIDWSTLQNYQVSAKNLSVGYEANGGSPNNFGENRSQRTLTSTKTLTTTSTRSTDADGKTTTSDNDNVNENNNDNSTFNGLVPTTIGEAAKAGASAASMGWKEAFSFSGQLSADNFNLVMSAFEQVEDAKIFSNPRIIVSNGKQAQVDMTTKYPNVRVTSNRTGGYSTSLDITAQLEQIPGEEGALFAKEVFFSWGITLQVTPRISPDGLINVEIVPMISDRTDWAEVKANGAEDSAYSKYPVINVQRLITDFTMQDGSTAVIGGLTQTKEEDVDSGIPYLRKLPWIGPRLFGWKGREKVQREIIVFVTVGIAHPGNMRKDIGLPKNAILGREYVDGRAFEPGDRGGVKKSMELDMRAVDERREEKDPEEGGEEGGTGDVEPVSTSVGPVKASSDTETKSEASTGPQKTFVSPAE